MAKSDILLTMNTSNEVIFSIFQHKGNMKINVWHHRDGLELLLKWGATTSQCITDVKCVLNTLNCVPTFMNVLPLDSFN